jgi:aspartate/glutamate racemase
VLLEQLEQLQQQLEAQMVVVQCTLLALVLQRP